MIQIIVSAALVIFVSCFVSWVLWYGSVLRNRLTAENKALRRKAYEYGLATRYLLEARAEKKANGETEKYLKMKDHAWMYAEVIDEKYRERGDGG